VDTDTDVDSDSDTDSDTDSDSDLPGVISITDSVPGWASQAGGTTGGGTDIGSAITVSSMGELQSAAGGSGAAIILVEPGDYNGSLQPGSNKTIIGKGPGVTINGYMKMSGSEVSNLIIRNLAVRGEHCSSYDECKEGADAVYMGNGAHHIWLDHIDIADGQDGNCDVTQGGDYITVSWTKFHYTYDKEHRFSNLIAGSDDEPASVDKLQITYMNCWWGDRVHQRQPRGRFGKVHMFNNLHSSKASGQYCAGPGVDIAMIIENCFYDVSSGTPAIKADFGTPRGWKAFGNEGNAEGMNSEQGTVFDIPYTYTAIPASEVQDAITSPDGGAGNTCTFQ
jgi:pectate lyase